MTDRKPKIIKRADVERERSEAERLEINILHLYGRRYPLELLKLAERIRAQKAQTQTVNA